MTFIKRLRSLFVPIPAPARPVAVPVIKKPNVPELLSQPEIQATLYKTPPLFISNEPLPYWLTSEESLRDEGVLFGLADAQPTEKVAEIRAHFEQQAIPLDKQRNQYIEKIGELNLLIGQRENRILVLQDQLKSVSDRQSTPNGLLRTTVSLMLAIGMSIGTFYLIDETLEPAYPNHWISIGVFLAGMFNLFGRTSFFYEESTLLTSRRVIEEIGLPLATSVFVLSQALKTQTVWQAGALFIFVFFLFLLAGKLLFSTVTLLQNGISISQANRQLLVDKQQNLPVWEAEIERLDQEIDSIRTQKWPVVTALTTLETDLARLNTRRDQLVNLFMSEYELARSIRNRLSEQQRESMFNEL
ncbi:hypothetical protein [Spirosoma endbachense]|uniref:Uncharacterized protein n=1 Tax=Spirosoma endbachense TaxID=2666025 RepID=A0A6P1VQ72_9BACT|nr:hypothetical protein [Spirosoma endbachense]QHV93749.1 hypothetical protein GJR95_01300 [Spirosoma endbachense]